MVIILTAAFLVMSLVQIGIFKALPMWMRNILARLPLLALIVNFLISGSILFFTGVGMVAGVSNLGASVVFAFYLAGYTSFRKLGPIKIRKYRGFIPYPYVECDKRPHWLF